MASLHLRQFDSNLQDEQVPTLWPIPWPFAHGTHELTNLDGFLLIQIYCLPHQSSQLLILLQPGLCQLMLFQHLIQALLTNLLQLLIRILLMLTDFGQLSSQLLGQFLLSLDCKQPIPIWRKDSQCNLANNIKQQKARLRHWIAM